MVKRTLFIILLLGGTLLAVPPTVTACAGDTANFNGFSYTDASPTTTAVSSSTLTTASMSVVLPMTGCSAGNVMLIRVTRSGADSHTGSVYGVVAEVSGTW